MPKMPPLLSVKRKAMVPIRREHVDAILAVVAPNPQLAFALGAFAGLRSGEIRALRWSDVDLVAGTVTIRSSISRGVECSPKSGHQDVLPLTPFLQSLLKAAQAKSESTWVNVSLQSRDKPWSESGLYKAFQKARDAAGFDDWTLHDLRHFFVSELFRRHVPAPFAQALARHSALTTTQRYADVDANDLREAVSHLDGNSAAMKKLDSSANQPTMPIT
jgi:integrase